MVDAFLTVKEGFRKIALEFVEDDEERATLESNEE